MANLAISTVCNLNCPYCFTHDYMGRESDGNVRHFLPLDDFEALLDFLDRSNIDEARLLGGEPTLHPEFPTLVERARARNKKIVVFTNGLMPEKALACLEVLPVEACFVLMNINAPEDSVQPDGTSKVFERQRAALARLGERVMPGFNIYRTDFRLDFLLDRIADMGCKPGIRLGLAQPCLSGDNRYIHPKQYRFIGEKIVYYAQVAAERGIKLDFDCGFVRCMFSDDELQTLERLETNVGWRCNPILDIDVHSRVIQCYPLSQLGSLPLTPDVDAQTLRDTFTERTRAYRQAGVFQECAICPFRVSGECTGGCLSATIRRFRHTPFSLTVPRQEAHV